MYVWQKWREAERVMKERVSPCRGGIVRPVLHDLTSPRHHSAAISPTTPESSNEGSISPVFLEPVLSSVILMTVPSLVDENTAPFSFVGRVDCTARVSSRKLSSIFPIRWYCMEEHHSAKYMPFDLLHSYCISLCCIKRRHQTLAFYTTLGRDI